MTEHTDFAERRFTSADGLSLFARDRAGADGPARLPVIAIHGLTRNSADFEGVAPSIADLGRRVISVDVRGRGQSDRATDPMSYVPPVYAQDVLALMDQAGIGRAIFLGTSMGGLITMVLAAAAPDRVAASILNDIGPEVAPEGLARIAAYAGQKVEITSWDDAAAYARRINEGALPHYDEADWMAFARRTFREGPDGVPALDYDPDISAPIRAAGKDALVPDLWPAFRNLAEGRPTLLIRGATSDLLNPAIAERMQAEAPDLTRVDIPAIGHAPMLDEPEAWAAIERFLAEAP
ncbi:alpha/beta fold hydrolase [Brevundimonas sp.]|uniref:alpha/beta fold hydrolase n=1 Tax=Brevundimonas sp. TaxID=1871086 RepID=UPI0035B1545F